MFRFLRRLMSGCTPRDRQWNLQGEICEAILVHTCLLEEGNYPNILYMYIHMSLLSLRKSYNASWHQLLWVKCMSYLAVAGDLFREARFWFGSSTCPWGAIAGISLLIFWCGVITGFAFGACIFSSGCRGILLVVCRALLAHCGAGFSHSAETRLAQYRRRG